MRANDTNVLVRLATQDDDRQVAAAEAFVAGGRGFLISCRSRPAVEMFLDQQNLVVKDSDTVASALESYRKRRALGLPGLGGRSQAGHLPLGTFDHALSKLDSVQKL